MTASISSRGEMWLRIAAFAAIYIIWGTTYLGINIAIRTVPPFISGGIRHLLAGALLYLWLRSRGPAPLASVNLRASALSGVLLSGIGNGMVIWAQQRIPTGVAALIITSVPVLVVLLDWLFFSRRAPNMRASVGTCIALAGVVAIVLHTRSLSGSAEPIYLISMLVAAIAWSSGTLLQTRSVAAGTLLGFTCAQMLFGGLFQLLMACVTFEWSGFDLRAVSLESLLAIGYLVVFGSIVAFTSYLWLLRHVAAQKVTTYALVNPVVALLLGALVLNERLGLYELMAATLVLAGVALVLFQHWTPRALWQSRLAPAREIE